MNDTSDDTVEEKVQLGRRREHITDAIGWEVRDQSTPLEGNYMFHRFHPT